MGPLSKGVAIMDHSRGVKEGTVLAIHSAGIEELKGKN
jgi:hypothetical protein